MALHDLIAAVEVENQDESNWDCILERCALHPEEVSHLDLRGRNCLSAACSKNPPLKVIDELLKECRFGSGSLRDKNGQTALAIAISSHACPDVIKKLTRHGRAVELSDYRGNAPLHLACMNEYRHGVEGLVSMLTEAAPLIVEQENNEGKLPLHLALETKSSVDVVRTLVEVCPETVMQSNSFGCTSLICAIERGADADVIKCLVRASPAVTLEKEQSCFPLQRALELQCDDPETIGLLCSSPATVLDVDREGENALQLALGRVSVNPEIVNILLRQAPESARLGVRQRGTPLHLAYDKYSCLADQIKFQGTMVDQFTAQSMEDWWMVTCSILKTATIQNEEALTGNGEWCVLHAALSTCAPIQFIHTVLKRCPCEVTKCNRHGHYPLMVAFMLEQPNNVKDTIIDMLLDADASSIGATRTDREGRVALFLALDQGGVSRHTFHRILRSNPEAIAILDPKHQLYPFLIAALPRRNVVVMSQIDCIFELILARPDVLQSVVSSRDSLITPRGSESLDN